MKHGRGKLSYANKDMYEGAWQDNKRHGEGTTTFADGDKYEGAWQDDKRHGEGTTTFADGDKYQGGWQDDKRHGEGTMAFADGGEYVGGSQDSMPHGQGQDDLREWGMAASREWKQVGGRVAGWRAPRSRHVHSRGRPTRQVHAQRALEKR